MLKERVIFGLLRQTTKRSLNKRVPRKSPDKDADEVDT